MAKQNVSDRLLEKRKKIASVIVAQLEILFPAPEIALKFSNRWELLVAVILSAQCTDKKVNEVTEKLFQKYTSLDYYVRADPKEFEKDIKSTGFFRNKAKNILSSAKMIKGKHQGKVPDQMEDLLELPGVARKTANIVLGVGFGKQEGIAVDTHVKRLSFLHGLTQQTNTYKIEKDLMKVVPKQQWLNFNLRLIAYGRAFCPAKKHDHENCPLSVKLKRLGLN